MEETINVMAFLDISLNINSSINLCGICGKLATSQ